jgi:hypothetical protein
VIVLSKDTWSFNAHCDSCTKDFTLKYEDIKTVVIDDIKVKYFECKHCKEKYITECIDDFIVKERLRYQRLNSKRKKQICMDGMISHTNELKLKVINRI